MSYRCFATRPRLLAAAVALLAATQVQAAPKVVLISLDGAEPSLVNNFLSRGVLPSDQGLGLLKSKGIMANQNVTVSPSLTAVAHIAIATGSSAPKNDVVANTFHLVASPFTSNISGFGAPIGGYSIDGPTESASPTAEPLWVALRAAGKTVAAATWPGADGATVFAPGLSGVQLQAPTNRTVDYTVPFGAFAGPGGLGFSLTRADFSDAPQSTVEQLTAANIAFYGKVKQKTTKLETITFNGGAFDIQVAAIDTSNDGKVNYDTLVVFDSVNGIKPGPFSLPSTGPAILKAKNKMSAKFYLEGSTNKVGTAFYVSRLDGNLAKVHLARYSGYMIPRNAPVVGDVDDVNSNVGFWAPQADFRFPERINSGLTDFTDGELEAIYEDQVKTFVDYQTRLALRALDKFPNADLLMVYLEQPDGSGHQFMLNDDRQASNFLDPNSIGAHQDPAKKARYASYLRTAYQVASTAVQRIIDKVGVDAGTGEPNSNVIVVSDHGFAPFHTAVSLGNYFQNVGIDLTKVRIVTSGPAANIYINLQGREANGTVSKAEYLELVAKVKAALWQLADSNTTYARSAVGLPVFDRVHARPTTTNLNDPNFGRQTSKYIGQDSGDIHALLRLGYNFDGTQNPVVVRQGDTAAVSPLRQVFSVPNFYGAHGYAPEYPTMSALFMAAGPDIGSGKLKQVHNIDVAPTILGILGVTPAPTVEGKPINLNP